MNIILMYISLVALLYNLLPGNFYKNKICNHSAEYNSCECNGGNDSALDCDENLGESRNITYCNHYQYFQKLKTNIGNNEMEATCGYVALSSLLTYYDSEFNGNIVASAYSVYGNSTESFGTNFEANSNLANTDVALYYNHMRNYKNLSLHSFLALMHKNALLSNPSNYCDTIKQEFGTCVAPSTNPHSIDNCARIYMCNYAGYAEGIDFAIETISTTYNEEVTGDDVITFVQNKINEGKPVWFGSGLTHHAVVVYGFSDSKFYVHNGYNGDLVSHDTLKEYLKTAISLSGVAVDAMTISFTGYTHNHVYNYKTSLNEYYCLCGYCPHYHSFTSYYVDYNANKHASYCTCGAYIYQRHDFLVNFENNPCRCGRSI